MTTTAALPAAVATSVAAAAPGTPRTGGLTDSRDPSGTAGHFDHQLDAARQQHDLPKEAVSTLAAHPPPAVTEESVPAAPDAHRQASVPEDTAAAALAGAMLALLGSSVAASAPRAMTAGITTAATSAAGGGRKGEGETIATDAKTAAPLQPGDAGSQVAAATGVLAATVGILPAAAGAAKPRDVSAPDAASGMAQAVALPGPGAHAAPLTMHVLQLQSPVGGHAFSHDLGQQVAWLGGQDLKQARIRLHPQELGQLDVSVSVTQGRVDVVFSAQHPAAVLAVQQSLPQLGHLLAQHGLQLGHAEVGQHERSDQRPHGGTASNVAALAHADEAHVDQLSPILGVIGLLDTFA